MRKLERKEQCFKNLEAPSGNKKMASGLHHTATTKYPCCVPTLGDSEGASCVGLAATKLQSIFRLTNENFLIFCNKIQYTTTHL